MELELGLKITRTREDVSSSVDFHFSKDPFGPLVLSQETDSRFIIIIHLKGFKKEGIEIDINKEGNRITVRGRKPVEEMVMIRWMVWMREVEFRVFKKVFRIPDIVDLDKIKARFNDDDATLTITMPKRVKGVSGFKIEEEEEEEERVEFGDVSEAGEVEEEEGIEREESDEQKDEEETEDDHLDKIHQIDEQDYKILQAEENEDSSLRKVADIERRDSHEQTRHEEQELVVQQQAETNNDDFGSRVLEEIGDLEPDGLDRKTRSGAMEKEMTDDDADDDADGLSMVQEIEEPERHNEEREIREMVEQKDEEETEDDKFDKIHQIDEQDYKILESIEEEEEEEEEKMGLQELAVSNKESEDSSLRKLPGIEGRDSHEQTRNEEHLNKVVEQKDSQAETNNSDDFGSRAFEENEEQEPDEQVDRTIESGATKKKTTNDDGDGSSKVQGIEEAERHNEESKNQEMVEGETGGHEKKNIVKMESKTRDSKEEVDGEMGEGFTTNIDRTQVVGGEDIAETDTKAEEFESDKIQEDKVNKLHELVEKKEEEGDTAKVRRQSEERSLLKVKDKEEEYSQGQRQHEKQEKIKELVEEKTPEAEENIGNAILKPVQEVDTLGTIGDEGKERKQKKKKKILKMEIKNGDAKEEVDAKMGEGLTPNIAETATKAEEFEFDKLKADEVDKIQKLVEKKKEEEEKAKVGTQSEEIGEQQLQGEKRHDKQKKIKELVEEQTLETNIGNDIPNPVHERCEEIKNQPEESKEKTGKKINDDDDISRKVQDIEQRASDAMKEQEENNMIQDLVKSKTNDEKKEEKEIAKTETKDQESYRPKILGEQEYIQEVAEEKAKFSKNRKVKEEEEIAEKKTEFGDDDDDISRKVQDIEQRASDAMKEQEEKDMIQESVLEEKVSDGGKGIITVADTKDEEGKSQNGQVIDEQQSHEDDKQFQKLIGGEISGHGGVEDVEKEKRISDSLREAQEIRKNDLDASEEYKGIYQNLHEEEKKNEADRPEKITGTVEQELVNLNSQLKQDNIEDGEKPRELVEEKIKNRKKEDGSEESKTKSEDDTERKVQGIKEHELYEPKGGHVCKIKELVEEKTDDHEKEEENEMAESKIEAECSEEKELHDQKIHKERDKSQITGADKPSGYEKEEEGDKFVESMPITENDNSADAQKVKKERPDKKESHEKQYKIQEVVEAGHDDHKEGKVMAKAELETEEESSKNVQETEQHEYDGLMRSMVQEKVQETEETEKDRATEEKEIVERRKKTQDDSLKNIGDDEDPELSKPYKRKKEDKIQELFEMGTSDYREKVKKQDEDDILRSQETGSPDLGEPSNIRQLMGEEQMENIAELRGKLEDDSSGKFHESEEVKLYTDWTHEEREKRKELVKEEVTDPKNKHTVGEDHNDHKEKQQDEKAIAKAELKTEEDSSKKVRDIEKQERDELKRSVVQDKMQETEEKYKTRAMEENDIVERRKKTKGGNLRKVQGDEDPKLLKPYKRTDLDEFEGHGEQDNIPQLVGAEKVESNPELGGKREDDDSSGKFHEFEEGKSYEDWTYEQREKRKDLVKEEATDPKDSHKGGKGHNDHKEESKQEKVISKEDIEKQELKSEGDSSKKLREIEKEKIDGLKRSMVVDKMQETEEKNKTRTMDDNEIVERREKTKDGSMRKVREGEDPKLGRHKIHGEEDRIQGLHETEITDRREEVKKEDGDVILRSQDTGKLDLGAKGERKMENISVPCGQMEGDDSLGKVHEFRKQKPYEDWRQEESEEIENLVKEEETDPKNKHIGGEGEHEEEEEEEEEEERYEKVVENKKKVEDDINRKVGDKKEPELDKHDRYEKLDKLEGVASDYEKEEENLVDDFKTKIQETEKEESHGLKRHDKLDIVPDLVEDETEDQEDEEAEEVAAVVASNESSRKVQTVEEGSENHKEQKKIPEICDHEVTEEDKERITEKEEVPSSRNYQENKEIGKDVQELEEKESNVSKRRTVEEENFQELKEVKKREQVTVDEEKAKVETKLDDGKSRKFEMSKMLELDESKENEEHKKILKPMEEKPTAPEIEKEGNGKIAEDEIDSRTEDQEIKGQEPYELLKSEEQDHILQYQREEENGMEQREIEEIRRTAENDSSRKVQQIKAQEPDGLDKHQKLREIQENRNIHEPMPKETQKHGEEEMNEGGGYKTALKTRSQDVEEKKSEQPKRYAEQEKIQELMTEEEAKEEYHIREGEQNEKVKIIPQVKSKANDDSLVKNETTRHKSTGLREDKKKENNQELVEIETSDQRKEEKEDEVVEKAETIDEYDCSRKIQEHEQRKSDKMSDNLAEEETRNDKEHKEGNRAGKVLGEVDTKSRKVRGVKEQDKKQSYVEKDTSGKAKETKSRDDSSRKKNQENEKQESHEQKRNEEHENNKLGLVEKKKLFFGEEDDGNEDKEIAEEDVPRKLKKIEKRELTKEVERNEDQDNIGEMVEEKMNNQEGEDRKSMIMKVLANAEDHESKGPKGQMKQEKNREQRIKDKLKDEEIAETETKSKDNESRKIHQIREQGRVNELEEDITHHCRDKENREKAYEDGSSKKIQEIDKDESVQPRRDEKQEKIQEPVDSKTSEDDEEELEVECEEEEEDWEAEVIQEMESDEDNDKIKQIKRIRLGFRLVGGSTLFMSLIVIVISFIRSKRKIRCYKF